MAVCPDDWTAQSATGGTGKYLSFTEMLLDLTFSYLFDTNMSAPPILFASVFKYTLVGQ